MLSIMPTYHTVASVYLYCICNWKDLKFGTIIIVNFKHFLLSFLFTANIGIGD